MKATLETLKDHIRTLNGLLLVPALRLTGFRFSKDYRFGATRYHRIVYSLIDTVEPI